MGAQATDTDHAAGLECDNFDPYFDHLILIDTTNLDPLDNVVGVYRLMRGDVAAKGIGFYGASEYDLTKLENSGRRVMELGRSCIDPAFRGGVALHLMWNGLRVVAQVSHHVDMNILALSDIDKLTAMQQMPPLIKAYLRLGGCVGQGAFVDQGFNTIDVCLVMDTQRMSAKHKAIYQKGVT
mgnify:CR=1 FL=1